jgi:hypothetical protein
MPFSAVTCLTYTGSTTLGGNMNLYSNNDGYLTPFQTGINISAITTTQCPYYISNVPDGTTIIRIFDTLTGCYCDLPVQSNDLCVTCNLNFTNYSASTVGRLVAGNLTGSCTANITDYRIFWYETGNTTTPAYVTGLGAEFTPYTFTHPLVGSAAIFAEAGTYIPVIDKIKLSGLTFSQTGGTGNIPAELECFTSTTVTVDAFTCDNGNTSDSIYYKHRVNFLSANPLVTPTPLQSTFLFTGVTDYFAWKFKGFSVYDRLRLRYSGSAYSEELLVEDIIIGENFPTSDFSLNKTPKSARTWNFVYLKKATCLTGLTRNPGDTMTIEVIPNQQINETNWDFYFTCLNSFDQNSCIVNNMPKIKQSSISFYTGNCNSITVQYQISGCTLNSDDLSRYMTPDFGSGIGYGTIWGNWNAYLYSSSINVGNYLYYNSENAQIYTPWNKGISCSSANTNTITFTKYISGGTIGIIDLTFSDVTDFNAYYNSYLGATTGTSAVSCIGPFSGTPYDATDLRYYRWIYLVVPTNSGLSVCGSDIGNTLYYYIHTSSQAITGYTGSNYTLRITMPTVYKGLSGIPSCNLNQNLSSFVSTINNSSTGTSNNTSIVTNTGSRYQFPFFQNYITCSATTSSTIGQWIGQYYVPKYLNETLVYSGTTPTIIPSLSAETFNFNTSAFTFNNTSNNLGYYSKLTFWYKTTLVNPLDVRDFNIYAKEITGGTAGSDVLIYSYTGATTAYTVHDSTYFI